MIINHNMNAMNAQRNMAANNVNAGKSMEKLSSGLRINKAGDDAAGLAISEKMRGQIRGLDQASRNAQDGISMIQTAEGALNETHSILQRMRELSVQASNDTNTSADRKEIQKEINQLTNEVTRIGNNTEFNTQKLLNGEKSITRSGQQQGQYTFDISTAFADGKVVIDGTTFTFGSDFSGADADTQLTNLKNSINTKLGSKYTASIDTSSGTVIKLVQVSGQESATAPSITSTATTGTATASSLVLAGNAGTTTDNSASLQIGANQSQQFKVNINDMRSLSLKISGTSASGAGTGVAGASFNTTDGTLTDLSTATTTEYGLDVTSSTAASAAVEVIDKAISSVSSERSKLGAYQNRLEHTIANLGTASENLTSAESRIRDVDMAKEMMSFSKNNILSQAAQAMLAQANQQPQGVLQLLR